MVRVAASTAARRAASRGWVARARATSESAGGCGAAPARSVAGSIEVPGTESPGARFRNAFTAASAATRSLSNANSSDRRRSRASFAWRGSLCGAAPVAYRVVLSLPARAGRVAVRCFSDRGLQARVASDGRRQALPERRTGARHHERARQHYQLSELHASPRQSVSGGTRRSPRRIPGARQGTLRLGEARLGAAEGAVLAGRPGRTWKERRRRCETL